MPQRTSYGMESRRPLTAATVERLVSSRPPTSARGCCTSRAQSDEDNSRQLVDGEGRVCATAYTVAPESRSRYSMWRREDACQLGTTPPNSAYAFALLLEDRIS